tara:strand:- start:48 stop:323 length:276 start_codon:yes stop_codon:yes gene_type:complete
MEMLSMKTSALLFFFLTMLFVISLFETPYAVADAQPYAGQHQRSIKALSKNDIQGYKSGAGLGMAKAAELNHYPGLIHILEFAAPLKLNKK